jgi:signal peptidase I
MNAGFFSSKMEVVRKKYRAVVPANKFTAFGETLVTTALMVVTINQTIAQSKYIPSVSMAPTIAVQDRLLVAPKTWFSSPYYNSSGLSKIKLGRMVTFHMPMYKIPIPAIDKLRSDDEREILNRFYSPHPDLDVRKSLPIPGTIINPELLIKPEMKDANSPSKTTMIKRVVGMAGDTIEVKQGKLFRNGTMVNEPFIAEPMKYTMPPQKVPAQHIFVMGDNRNDSFDGHIWGPLPLNNIEGTAYLRYWPITKMAPL